MKLKIRHLRLRSVTTSGTFAANIPFGKGVTILRADNSMGKSTCIQSIVYALGLERVLGPQHDVPLTPAMTRTIEDEVGEHKVLESDVYLEIENDRGDILTIQRSAHGTRDKNLVSTWDGPAITQPSDTFRHRDFFASDPGSAMREAGFQKKFADFLGWNLPKVTRFNGQESPLYLECIFPLMVVEQKHGWTGVQGNLPTFLGIKEMGKRAIEFICNLEAYDVAAARTQIQQEEDQLKKKWKSHIETFNNMLNSISGRLVGSPATPVSSWPPEIEPHIEAFRSNTWISLSEAIKENQSTLDGLQATEVPVVSEVSHANEEELTRTREEISRVEFVLNEAFSVERSDRAQLMAIEQRLGALNEDLKKNKDVAKLRKLGSVQQLALSSGHCPTCNQLISDTLLFTTISQNPLSVEENINFIQSQIGIFEAMRENIVAVMKARTAENQSLRQGLSELRAKLRALKQTLISPNGSPSVASIRERLLLEDRIKAYKEIDERFAVWMEESEELSAQWRGMLERKSKLPEDGLSEGDSRKLKKVEASLVSQLKQYGFSSMNPESISIDPESYRPTREGFNLGFDLSASDNIRTIWAYLTALLELARDETTNHLGLLIFDEPRQQAANPVHFGGFLKRAALSDLHKQQVILATSEPLGELKTYLEGVPHSLVVFDGKMLKKQS